ncbi:cation:proton antiporter [Candidatus Woesearchaeota archaeon]|nr:cation:proton antiporter [Candidatus Woesearchaeota archaeon]
MDALYTILLCIVIANTVVYAFSRMRIPHVISLLLVGFFMGLPQIHPLLISPNDHIIDILGDVGIILTMLIAGLNSSKELLYKEEHDSLVLAIMAAFFTFAFSFVLFMLLKFSVTVSLIIAICMSITAEATNIEVLLFLKKLHTKIGTLIIEAGLIDDIIGIFIFMVISYVAGESSFVDNLLLIVIFGAFIVGVIMQRFRDTKLVKFSEIIAKYAFIPFFFISLGIAFDFRSLAFNPIFIVFVIAVALIGKLVGTLLSKPFVDLKLTQLYLIGWAMNSRGSVGLVLSLVAFRNGLISHDIYSTLLIMIFATTLIFPIVVSVMLKKDPHILSS